MDAAQALAELMQLSTQVEVAVVLGPDGKAIVSSPEGSATADSLAGIAFELTGAASELGSGQEVTRVEVELADGAVFVLSEGGRTVAARTGPEPSAGLVVYDLRTCLRSIEDEPKRKRASRKAKAEPEPTEDGADGEEQAT
jgi:predicted regulator of Ras-like GTPase activity (Roadblock/LC7/MglB family)